MKPHRIPVMTDIGEQAATTEPRVLGWKRQPLENAYQLIAELHRNSAALTESLRKARMWRTVAWVLVVFLALVVLVLLLGTAQLSSAVLFIEVA